MLSDPLSQAIGLWFIGYADYLVTSAAAAAQLTLLVPLLAHDIAVAVVVPAILGFLADVFGAAHESCGRNYKTRVQFPTIQSNEGL